MKPLTLYRHAESVTSRVLTWEEWKALWLITTDENELLGLLHRVFRVELPEAPLMRGQANRLDHPDALSARYRFLLHIADASTGYSLSVRKKAFEMLFGGKHLRGAGLFPQERTITRKELNTLFWFLRPMGPAKLKCYDNFVNYDVIDAANKSTKEKFWNSLEACIEGLWRGYLHLGNHYSSGGIKVTSETHRLIALRILLHIHDVDFIKQEIWMGVKRVVHSAWTAGRGTPDGCIKPQDIEKMEQRLTQYCTPDALQLISTTQTPGGLSRKPLFDDALSTGNASALFLQWVTEFRKNILPAERAKTEAALAEQRQRHLEKRRQELERERQHAEEQLQALSEHDD